MVRDRIVGLRRVPARELAANPRNWRRHPPGQAEALRAMLEDVGFAGALLARETDAGLELIDGHLRREVAPEEELPVLVLDVDEAEAAKLLASLDPLAGMAVADPEALRALLADVELPGELDGRLRALAGPERRDGLADPDALAEPAAARAAPGDVWALGAHRLACGDSRDAGSVGRLLGEGAVDLVATSPPYNVGIGYSAHDDREAPAKDYLGFLREVADAWVPRIAPGRFVAWNVGVSPRTHHFRQAALLEDAGLSFLRELVWVKAGVPLPTFARQAATPRARRYAPDWRHELVYVFSNGPPAESVACHELVYLFATGAPEAGARTDLPIDGHSDVWDFIHQSAATRGLPERPGGRSGQRGLDRSRPGGRHVPKAHPAAFPVRLPLTLIELLTAPGEMVADPFAGTGTTIVAAEMAGRRAVAMEIDPAYCDLALARWEAFAGGRAERLEAGAGGR